ncbi:MAG TPA: serine/threonine-protein kinase [Kofleriaceae bacterium]|nr:serine/threonine-protein kinase [Kofleriaceae bacterium]
MKTVLGDAEVLHAIKSGGMGDVLLARRRGAGDFEQLCAIKTIRGELASAPVARTMFLDEAKLLARLTHPSIAQILGFGEQDGTLYMMMEYVPGEHFRRFRDRRPPPAIVCAAMAAACRGLHAAHELRDLGDGHLLGVVHRDISPDNLMLGFDARVKVLDFGIALVKGRQAPVTELGVLKGKPPYMSPEQVKNQALDRRSDVFSACVVLHELLTGQLLFEGDSIYAIARAVEHQEIAPPSRLAGPLPAQLDDVVMAGLERDGEKRLASAAALAEVLERIAAASARESLEAWTERELAAEREQHRTWLARILAASGPMRVPAGRATGMVTAVAPETETETATETETESRTAGTDAARRADGPRRGRGWIVLAVLLLLGALAAVLVLGIAPDGGDARATDAGSADANVDAVIVVPTSDAAIDDAAIDDANDAGDDDPRDAGRSKRRDAGTIDARITDAGVVRPVDAAPAATLIDAATPTGTGFLTCTADPYALVTVDGVDLGSTPFFRKPIAAGGHEVVLTSPVGGAVVKRARITIAPGQTVTVSAP